MSAYHVAFSSVLLLIAGAAHANKLMSPGTHANVAKGAFALTTGSEWNRLKFRPGKFQEIWTIDGERLNRLTFFGGVPVGQTLFHERDKKNAPLPKVTHGMLVTDIAPLLDATYQSLGIARSFEVRSQRPAEIKGRRGVRFDYRYISPDDEVERLGEAVGLVENGRMYLVTFEAPEVHFYDRDKAKFEEIVSSLAIGPVK